jgi:AbrB family looped-hinge helix DNA binding protein
MAVVLAIYGAVDLVLLLAAKVVNERVKPLFRALGVSKDSKHASRKEEATEGTHRLGELAMRRTKTNAKGQVTIPADLRARLGIEKGTRMNWKEERGRLVLTPMTKRFIHECMGILKPPPGEPSAFDGLFAERERERKREDLKYALLAGTNGGKIETQAPELGKTTRRKGLVASSRERVRRK